MDYYKKLAEARRIFRQNPSVRVVYINKEKLFPLLYGHECPGEITHGDFFPVYRFDFYQSDLKALAFKASAELNKRCPCVF